MLVQNPLDVLLFSWFFNQMCLQFNAIRCIMHLIVSNPQEVSAMLLEKLVAAGIGSRPVVFISHRLVLIKLHTLKPKLLDYL